MATSENISQLASLLGEVGNLVKTKLVAQPDATESTSPQPEAIDAAVVAALSLSEQNALQLETHLLAISAGRLQVSAGDLHKSLERLTSKNFVSSRLDGDRQVYALTDAGRVFASEFKKEVLDEAAAPDESPKAELNSGALDFFREASKLAPVMLDLAQTGTQSQRSEASELLRKLRQDLHDILAN